MPTSAGLPEIALARLVDDVAARSDSATGSMRLLYQATAPGVLSLVCGWVPPGLVDDVVVGTYRRAWRIAGSRPARAPVQSWLHAIALSCARQVSLVARHRATPSGC